MTPDVSVIVPCRNAAAELGDQLRALAAQSHDGPWEVVVVDDGSTDGTSQVAEDHRPVLPALTVVRRTGGGNVSAARNAGIAVARGDRLLFCDADDVVAPGWVAAMVEALATADIVGGAMDAVPLNPAWVLGSRATQREGLQTADVAGWDLLHGGPGNLGITRRLLDAIGPFDEDEGVARQEGVDLFFRAQLAGFTPAFAPDAVVAIRLRTSLRAVYRQARGWAEGSVAIHRKFAPLGMPEPSRWRGLAAWVLVPLRLAAVRGRGDLARWVHLLGWRVGRLRGSVRERMLAP